MPYRKKSIILITIFGNSKFLKDILYFCLKLCLKLVLILFVWCCACRGKLVSVLLLTNPMVSASSSPATAPYTNSYSLGVDTSTTSFYIILNFKSWRGQEERNPSSSTVPNCRNFILMVCFPLLQVKRLFWNPYLCTLSMISNTCCVPCMCGGCTLDAEGQ